MDKRSTSTTTTARGRARLARRSARSRGAVIVLTLLGAFMVAGMIGYVFNAGRHAQLRQQTQHAADATAVSGSGYVARSFNTVAMNNVEISRLIAVVQMLDAVPLAVEYTLLDTEATLERVEQQQRSGTGDAYGDQTLDEIAEDLRDQIRQLTEMDEFFNRSGYDVREMTFYESEFGRGELWKAMESLHAISDATMQHLGELRQVTAVETGRRNMSDDSGEAVAAIAPFEDAILWQQYDFDDFRDPVVRGRLPRWVDDEVTNRGPYDTIFGWRSTQRESIEIPNPNYNPQDRTTTSQRPGSRWSGGTGRGGRGQPRTISVGSTLVGYTTYGTWQWLGDVLRNRIDQQEVLYNSQFVTRVNRMGGNKLNYLWPGSARQWVFLDPQWITSYEEAQDIIAAGTPRPAYTQFVRMDYEQRFLNGQPVGPELMDDWSILRPRGGWLEVPGATKVRDHVWEDQATVEWTTTRVVYENGQRREIVDEHEIRYRWLFVWAAMNVGPEITIRDPNNFASREELPKPIDFDHEQMPRPIDGAVGRPGSPFTFLGLAKQRNSPPLWEQLFTTSAYDGHAGIAQASVFNNHSWDLWTQMWHAQLEPVQDYDRWIDLMKAQIGAASGYQGLSVGELQETIDYLESLEELAPVMLNH
ncbi:MAG: Tad domain-containing protein [Phycisphaeraceae bacterium]